VRLVNHLEPPAGRGRPRSRSATPDCGRRYRG
jgi:hypothetical protein